MVRRARAAAEPLPLPSTAVRFTALVEKDQLYLHWTVVRLPFAPSEVWSEMVRLRVAGEVRAVRFRTSLFAGAAARPGFFLLLNRQLQGQAAIAPGSRVELALWPDLEGRPAELPDALAVFLDEEPGLRDWYEQLSESMRRELGKWILAVQSSEAQERRSTQAAERLLATMEAERELPPLIAKALRSHPDAAAGWARMTETQRRRELMGVFYYQSPEARARRVHKLCDMAAARGAATRGAAATSARDL